MRIKAINLYGKTVYGCGFSASDEEIYEGRSVGYIFCDKTSHLDGSEFRNNHFDFIFIDSVEIIND